MFVNFFIILVVVSFPLIFGHNSKHQEDSVTQKNVKCLIVVWRDSSLSIQNNDTFVGNKQESERDEMSAA